MKAKNILIIVLIVGLIVLAGLYFIQRGKAVQGTTAPPVDDSGCSTDPNVVNGIITLAECKAKKQRDIDAKQAAADKAAADKKKDQQDHILAAMTMGLSKAFNLKW